MKKFLSLSIIFAALCCFGWSQDGESPWLRIDDSLVTPHRHFAVPSAGKRLRAMILANGIGQRELVELKQRFDYDYVLLPIQNQFNFSPFIKGVKDDRKELYRLYAQLMNKEEYLAELKKILDQLPDCDLIVIGKLPFDALPNMVQNRFLNHVKNGKSMILIGRDGQEQTLDGCTFQQATVPFPMDAIPALAGTQLKRAALGKGTVLTITYPQPAKKPLTFEFMEPLTPFDCDHPLYYDYTLAFLGKCMWKLTDPKRLVIKDLTPQGTLTLTAPVKPEHRLQVEIADVFGKVLFTRILTKADQFAQKNATAQGTYIYQLPIPWMPATARLMDLRLIDAQGRTLDFTTTAFKPACQPLIKAINLPKDGWKPDEVITGTIELTQNIKVQALLTMTDNLERVIFRQEMTLQGPSTPFQAPLLHQLSTYAQLNVTVFQNNRKADEARTPLYFDTSASVDDFRFGMWTTACSKSRVNRLWLKEMNRYGVDNVMDAQVMFQRKDKTFLAPRNIKQAGMDYAIYITRLVGDHWLKNHQTCPYNYWEKLTTSGSIHDAQGIPWDKDRSVMTITEGAKNLGVLFYNLGDENCATLGGLEHENCFCPDCQRRFRNYLKREYKTIKQVNASYGSNYTSFEEIKALPFVKAIDANRTSLWLDFRMFMEEQFIDWHRYCKAKIRTIDPDARVGIEGMVYPANSFTGFNLYKMLPHFEFCAPYFNARDSRAVTQYMNPNYGRGVLKSAWFGTYEGEMTDQYVRQPPWRYLFAGLGGAFYWYSGDARTSGTFTTSCINGPDLRMLRQFTEAAKEINTIKRSGVGKLLMSARLRDDRILVHYSNYSLHASTLNPDQSTWEISHNNLAALLESLGLGYRYISPEALEQGVPAGTKVLFLPYSQAMSDAENQAIRAFVKQGGTVIADFNPAIATKHGKFLDKSALQDVFKTLGKLHIQPYGKGLAVCLHDYLSGVQARISKNEAAGIQRGMLRLLARAGIAPAASVKDERGCIHKVSVFSHGKDLYLGLLGQIMQQGQKRQSAAGAEQGASSNAGIGGSLQRIVTLPKPMHVYDILDNSRYLGKVKTFKTTLEPAVGRVFACLETPAKQPHLKLATTSVSQGQAMILQLQEVDNTAILTIRNPEGKTVLEQRVSGSTARFIPAYSDKPGTYRAVLRNVVGGLSQTLTFNVVKH